MGGGGGAGAVCGVLECTAKFKYVYVRIPAVLRQLRN
jgi:hypothetical protein